MGFLTSCPPAFNEEGGRKSRRGYWVLLESVPETSVICCFMFGGCVACAKSQALGEVPIIPPHLLYDNTFFLAPPRPDLSDLECYLYPPSQVCPLRLIKKEVLAAIHQPKAAEVSSRTQYQAVKNTDMTLPDLRRAVISSTSFQIAYTMVIYRQNSNTWQSDHTFQRAIPSAGKKAPSPNLSPGETLFRLRGAFVLAEGIAMICLAKMCSSVSHAVGSPSGKSTELALELRFLCRVTTR